MRNSIIPAIAIAFIIGSCGQKQTKPECKPEVFMSEGKYYPMTSNVVNYTEDNLPKVEWFTLKKIDVPKRFKKPICYMHNDSIMLIVTSTKPDPYLLTVMNHNTKEIIAEYFEYGVKRKNYRTMHITQRGGCYNIKDYEKGIVSRLYVDSVIAKTNEYVPHWTTYAPYSILDFVYPNDSTITWVNQEYVKGFGLNGIPNFVQTNTKGRFLAKYPRNKNITPDALFRTIAIIGSHYIEFWSGFPIINIYDKNFRIEKQYRDTKLKDIELILEDNMVMSKGVALACFEFACQSDKYVFANNYRSSTKFEGYMSLGNDPANGEFYETWVFDNNCNLVRRFKCRNLKGQVVGLSYCDQTGNMYMNVIDEKGIRTFYQCIFEKQ